MEPILKSITNSSRTTFLDCPFKFFLEYMLRLSPKTEPDYFIWGDLVHQYAEGIDNGIDEQLIQATIAEGCEAKAIAKNWPANQIEKVDLMCKILPSVFAGWQLRWHEDNKQFEQLGVENKFSYLLPNGTSFEGKIDKVVRVVTDGNRMQAGDEYVWERKTARLVDDHYLAAIELDSQPKGYCLAAKKVYGFNVKGVIYDIFLKPQIRQKQTETLEQFYERLGGTYIVEHKKYFVRYVFKFSDQKIDEYEADLIQTVQYMEYCISEGIYSKYHPKHRMGGCTYFPICISDDGIQGSAMKRYVSRSPEEMHPELFELSEIEN